MPLEMVDSEVNAILSSGLDPDHMLGNVTAEIFMQRINETNANILFLLTHGTSEGIQLSDGLLPKSMFVQAVKNKFDLIVLNVCESLSVAQMVQNECRTGVICTITEVDDRAAYYTGAKLSRELGKGADYFDAYDASRPGGNTDYIYLAGRMDTLHALVARRVREEIEKEMAPVVSSIAELRELIDQDRRERRASAKGVSVTSDQLRSIALTLVSLSVIVAIVFFWLGNGG